MTQDDQPQPDFEALIRGMNPNSEVESWAAKGARPSGRFNIHQAYDSRRHKTMRTVMRRERRAPTDWLWTHAIFTSEFGMKRRQHLLRDARRFHTKNLFGLWLLLVLAASLPIFVMIVQEKFLLLLPISMLLLLLIVLTGAYVFQEVARVHRRIDAILKLLEETERK